MYHYLKLEEKFMIISITEIDKSYYNIIFARKNPYSKFDFAYKGLIIRSLKTSDSTLYANFTRYGEWLKRRDKDLHVLLYLLNTEQKNHTQVEF